MNDEATRPRFCDVVMKGGITSGVVYPKAIVTLAKTFGLKNIGGTSAGAIAAAAAAAAEYAKRKGSTTGGYDVLAGLPVLLSKSNKTGNTNLFTFFQPQPKTKALFDTLTAALGATGTSAILKVVPRTTKHFGAWTLIGILPGTGLAYFENIHGFWLIGLLWLGVGLIVGILLAIIQFALAFGKRVGGSDGNFFGLCSGMSTDPKDDLATGPHQDGQALTIWLTKYLNELAGLDPDGPPLTFGQLWNPDAPVGSAPKTTDKAICLEMFTTCLTKGRPFRLPFRNEEAVKENVCYFTEADFQKFFPPNVITWMKDHPRTSLHPEREFTEGFHRMPDPWNLPVVVATRMSLSFPILLSAMRLWADDHDLRSKDIGADREAETNPVETAKPSRLSPCWFSDGGICSNFPIHLFDSPLPRWATFGMNLVETPQDTPDAEIAKPTMPATNRDGIQETWTELQENGGLGSIVGFIWSIIGTMQNWQDNTLSRMPGYRDRIAQVGLRPKEGGLNLNMPQPLIQTLSDRGDAAAQEFIKRFADLETVRGRMNWQNHRWLRFRSMVAALDEMFQSIDRTCEEPEPGDKGYEEWIKSLETGAEPSYFWRGKSMEQRDDQRALAIETLERLRELADTWEKSKLSAADGTPRPRPELKPRPRI